MRFLRSIAVLVLSLAGMSLSAQELDSLTRQVLSTKLDEYFSAIESAGADVQKEEADFLIGTATDSLLRQFIAVKVYQHYFESPVMGAEAVAIHVLDKWFIDQGVKMYDEIDLLNARIFADFNRQSLIGMPAPELALKTMDDQPCHLYAEPSERYSVLYFYDTDCAKCKLETMMLGHALQDKNYPVNFNAVYVGDNMTAWQEYTQANLKFEGLSVRHFWDPEIDSDFQRKYGVLQTPRMFLIAPDGEIIGRSLDTKALVQLLEQLFAERTLEYGDPEAEMLFDQILGEAPMRKEILSVAEMLQNAAMKRGDMYLYKHLIGNYLYYLAPETGEEFKEALRDFIPQYILSRTDIWSTEDDKLKVVGFAEILNDLLSKSAPGTVIPDIKVKGEYIKGTRSTHKKKSLRKLSGKENIIIFHTVGCHICEAQIKAARELAAADSDVRVFLVNVDKIIEENPTLSSTLFDSFDLSALPHILQTDKEGNIQRRYISLK